MGDDWDDAAGYWDAMMGASGDYFQEHLLVPAIREELDVTDGTVLDAGCGNGHLARTLSADAASVTAVDASAAMLERARTYEAPGSVRYRRHDLTERLDDRYDAVVCNTVIQDIEPYEAVIETLYDALDPGGTLVMTTRHPCFMPTGPGEGWSGLENGGKGLSNIDAGTELDADHVRIRDYGSGTFERQWGDARTTSYARTIEDYVSALTDAGFRITGLREPSPTEAGHDTWPAMADLLERIPHFLLFTAEKPERC